MPFIWFSRRALFSRIRFCPQLTLGDLNQDGDLFLRIKLCTVELSEGISFEVLIDHATETEDYVAPGSRFHLLPFETSVWERETGEFLWETPGGGKMAVHAREDAVPKNPPDIRMGGFPAHFPKFARLNNTLAGWNDEGDAWVRNENWELGYKSGGLAAIRNPENKLLSVKANGGKIAEIRAGNRVLASVEWSASGNPSVLRCGENRYVFVEDEQGRMARIIDEEIGTAIIELSYNKNGLVERVRRIGAKDMNVSWKANRGYGRGDSFYRKPFSVEKINDTKYDYFRAGNRVTMKMKPPDGDWKRLRWELQNGRVTLVR
ncbi:hypothetical protein OH491_22085 [Termitidicoccus mucosus]|uniref:hypothetical protein n=2 Tax=Termitidicoccus mucosus TaxID=1184151 RepID=UPI003183A79A